VCLWDEAWVESATRAGGVSARLAGHERGAGLQGGGTEKSYGVGLVCQEEGLHEESKLGAARGMKLAGTISTNQSCWLPQ
jgi:hypothetical protein